MSKEIKAKTPSLSEPLRYKYGKLQQAFNVITCIDDGEDIPSVEYFDVEGDQTPASALNNDV